MPGMAASTSIFERIHLPKETFTITLLEWFIPDQGMTIEAYAKKMCEHIKDDHPVLIGVSFGGLLVQEMAKHIKTQKTIIISSVKSSAEYPKRIHFTKYTKLHKVLPTGLVNNVELIAKYAFGERIVDRLELYEKYLSVRDKYYLDWSLDAIVNWKQKEAQENIIHIHGEKDLVFPISKIKNCIPVENGTHAMIIYKYKWFNENLPTIILQ